MCEYARAAKHRIDSAKARWTGWIATLVPNDPNEVLEDGREGQGVSRLSEADIHFVMEILFAMADEVNYTRTLYDCAKIEKPCVRALSTE
jgi:hypothetical protein